MFVLRYVMYVLFGIKFLYCANKKFLSYSDDFLLLLDQLLFGI